MSVPAGVRAAIVGAVLIAAVSTLGDFIWAGFGLRHRPAYGLAHGTLLFLCIGLYLGVTARRPALGAFAGALIGFAAAGSFYLLAPLAGYSVMFLVWFGLWIALGAFNGWLNGQIKLGGAFVRGIIAAVLSGLAFYLVSGIWLPFDPKGWDYLAHFGAWTLAYLPGFAALFIAANDANGPIRVIRG